MEIRQLQHFLSVARHGSLSAAATSLGITQSAVSSSLASLERELGTTLVDRAAGRRNAALTDPGQAFLEPAQRVMRCIAEARSAVATATSTAVAGTVQVATVVVPEPFSVLSTLLDLRATHPGLDVVVSTVGSARAVEMVADGSVDFALAALDASEVGNLAAELVLESRLGVVCRPDHRLARAELVRAADLRGEQLLGLPTSQRPRQLMDAWLAQDAPAVSTALESADPTVLYDLVRAGRGVSYAPEVFAGSPLMQGLSTVTMQDAPEWNLSVFTRGDGVSTPAANILHRAHVERCRRAGSA